MHLRMISERASSKRHRRSPDCDIPISSLSTTSGRWTMFHTWSCNTSVAAHYVAPEQIRRQAVDARTDVYALGVVLFEMLTGERPFQAPNLLALYYQHVSTPPKPIHEINPAVPPALEQITARALAKAPEQRY